MIYIQNEKNQSQNTNNDHLLVKSYMSYEKRFWIPVGTENKTVSSRQPCY